MLICFRHWQCNNYYYTGDRSVASVKYVSEEKWVVIPRTKNHVKVYELGFPTTEK